MANTALAARVQSVFGRMGGQAQGLAQRMQASIARLRSENTKLKAGQVGAKLGSAGLVVAGGAIGGAIEGTGVPDVGPVKVEYLVGVPAVIVGAFVDGWIGTTLVGLGAGVVAHAAGEDVSNVVAEQFAKQRAENTREDRAA